MKRLQSNIRTLGLIALIGIIAGAVWFMSRGDFRDRRLSNAPIALTAQPLCRRSPYAALQRSARGEATAWSVSGEQNVDAPGVEIAVASNSGSLISTTRVKVFEPTSKRTTEATFEVAFDWMLNPQPLSDGLTSEVDAAWLRMLEHSAFEAVCSAPDPSLQRLLTQDTSLQWWSGTPYMPDNYAVFIPAAGNVAAHWLEYLGFNHRRLTAERSSEELLLIDQQGTMQLLRSGHGAVVVDTGRQAYAWVYVFPGGRELRSPSVIGGSFQGNTVILKLDHPTPALPSQQIAIDLHSGGIRSLDGTAPSMH